MKSIREEIARSRQTVDTDPIQYDHHEDVDVEMYANDRGQWTVVVNCLSNPALSVPAKSFPDEASAEHHKRQSVDRIVRREMNEVKRLIRKLILEVSSFGCNNHSLGYINDKGEFIDLTETNQDHLEYLGSIFGMDAPDDCPENWIKVGNANNVFMCGDYWNSATEAQIDGLIDMWASCKEYSNWIEDEIETAEVTFGVQGPDGDMWEMNVMTVVEFLEMYGYRGQIDRLFNELLG